MPYHSEDRTILVGNSDFLCSFEVDDGEVLIESIRIRDHGANSFGAGNLLQFGTPVGLPNGPFLAGDMAPGAAPEPASLSLFGLGLAGIGFLRRRRR